VNDVKKNDHSVTQLKWLVEKIKISTYGYCKTDGQQNSILLALSEFLING